MKTLNNLTEQTLLLNLPIYWEFENEIFNAHLPTITQIWSSPYYYQLAGLLTEGSEDIANNPAAYGFVAESMTDTIIGLRLTNQLPQLLKVLKEIFNINVEKNGLFINEILISEELFQEFSKAFLIGMGRMTFEGSLINEEEDEWDKKEKEYADRIGQIKNKETSDSEDKTTYNKMIVLIAYELNMPLEEIKKLNLYGLHEFYKYALLSIGDKVNKAAMGSGMFDSSKHKFKNITQ